MVDVFLISFSIFIIVFYWFLIENSQYIACSNIGVITI